MTSSIEQEYRDELHLLNDSKLETFAERVRINGNRGTKDQYIATCAATRHALYEINEDNGKHK